MIQKITNPVFIIVLVVMLALLVSGGCLDTSSGNLSGSNTPVSSPSASPSIPTKCTLSHRDSTGGVFLSAYNVCYFTNHTARQFLEDLTRYPGQIVSVFDPPEGWITQADAEAFMQQIDSDEPAASVVSPISSYMPFNENSTVGNEAMFLLEGYRTGRYPPALSSLYYFRPNRTEIRQWWEMYGKNQGIDEATAIRLARNGSPSLSAFPSDQFPVKTIRTEQAAGGWYVAFIIEGSGVPIIAADCYFIESNRTVIKAKSSVGPLMVMPEDFSPQTCG